MLWGDSPGQTVLDRLRLAFVRDRADDGFRFHDLADGHRDRLLGNLRKGLEPPLAHLLPAAGLVEVHHEIRSRGFEVGRWIVECEMPVLADAGKANIDRVLGDDCPNPPTLRPGFALSIDVVKCGERQRETRHEPLPQVFTERGRMRDRRADIFVEVEGGDARPIDPGLLDEPFDHFKLRGAGGHNDVGFSDGGFHEIILCGIFECRTGV